MDVRNMSVSHESMRHRDLLPAFALVLKELDEDGRYADAIDGGLTGKFIDQDGNEGSYYTEDGYETNDSCVLLEILFDALNECAPDGFYFGSHPGDGCDYGFWELDAED